MMVEIRQATQRDLPDILELYAQPDMDQGNTVPLERAQAIFQTMCTYPNYHVYVACSEQHIVGTFALLIMENLVHMGTPSAIVEDVVVKECAQGQGIGKQMMRYAMQYSKQMGCYKLVLSSNLKRLNAHRFYESLGFVQHGYSYIMEL